MLVTFNDNSFTQGGRPVKSGPAALPSGYLSATANAYGRKPAYGRDIVTIDLCYVHVHQHVAAGEK